MILKSNGENKTKKIIKYSKQLFWPDLKSLFLFYFFVNNFDILFHIGISFGSFAAVTARAIKTIEVYFFFVAIFC